MGSFDTSKTDETLRNVFAKKQSMTTAADDSGATKEGMAIELLKGMYDPGTNHGCNFGNQQIILFASWQIAYVEL